MKKLILLAVFAATTGICSAQISFGIHVGPNFGMGKFKVDEKFFDGTDSHSQKNKMKVGVVGGFIVEVPIGSMLAFRPEVNFLQEGTKYTWNATAGGDVYSLENNVSLNYIQVPLNVIYKVPAGAGTVFFGLGPEVAIGLSGKNKQTQNFSGVVTKETRDIKFDGKKSEGVTDPAYYDKDHLKRVNVGLNVLAGYKLAMGVFMKIGYSHGFIDTSVDKSDPDVDERTSYKTSGFNISFGYMFGGSKSKK